MPPYGYGLWYGPWLIFPIIGLVLMAMMVFLMFGRRGPFAYFTRRGGWGDRSERDAPYTESAIDILKRGYARGEISREQFEQMRRGVE